MAIFSSKKQVSGRFYDASVVPEQAVELRGQEFRSRSFPAKGPKPWLDRPDAAEQIDRRLSLGEISEYEASLCRQWEKSGYVILDRFFGDEELDQAWNSYEQGIKSGKVKPPHEPLFEGDTVHGRVLNPHMSLEPINKLLMDVRMREVVNLLLGVRAIPFQTIIGHKSSEQLQHSDSIHMSTYPQGYLVANWIAFEDIHPDSGPLVYHPGSHKLPYLLPDDLGMPYDLTYSAYHGTYEPAVQKKISDHSLETKYFTPNKGDVLLWHANLLHGGSKLKNPEHVSRKALVCHFFAEGCVCYHDLTGMPAHINPVPFNAPAYLQAYPEVAATGMDPYLHYIQFGRREGRSTYA